MNRVLDLAIELFILLMALVILAVWMGDCTDGAGVAMKTILYFIAVALLSWWHRDERRD